MKCLDGNGHVLKPVKESKEIVDVLNSSVQEIGVNGPRYYVQKESDNKTIISNVDEKIYQSNNLEQFIAPVEVSSEVKRKIEYFLTYIDFIQKTVLHPQEESGSVKTFSVNNCYHNSYRVYTMGSHLHEVTDLPIPLRMELVIGFMARKIPFGTQLNNVVIESDVIELHDWHAWNYVEGMIVDMTAFDNGGILPSDSCMPDWGKAADHIAINPPEQVQYRGIRFNTLERFNDFVGELFGIKM